MNYPLYSANSGNYVLCFIQNEIKYKYKNKIIIIIIFLMLNVN